MRGGGLRRSFFVASGLWEISSWVLEEKFVELSVDGGRMDD